MSEYLDWVIHNPVQSFFILLAEYIVIFILYHQTKFERIVRLAAIPFVIQDAIVNIFVLTWFLELPKEWLVTARLKRWKQISLTDDSKIKLIRRAFAWRLCDLLNKFDPEHC